MASAQMLPGNPIPASLATDQGRHRLFDPRRSKSAAITMFVGNQYFVANESNQAQRLACYAV
jgi:hypothetical protein